MKKMLSSLMAALLLLASLTGCAGSPKSENTQTQATAASSVKTVTDGVLTVATSPDFAPMEFVDPGKQGQDMYVGFDISLAKFLAQYMGLELQIMPMSFDACQTAVYAGTVDLAISGFAPTQERGENYNMSQEYHTEEDSDNEQTLITLAVNADKYATAEGLKGAKIGVQNASLQQSLTQEQLPDSQAIPFTDLGTAVLQLKSGDFDCLAVAGSNGDAIISGNPEIVKSGFFFVTEDTGNVILLQKGADALTELVNAALDASASQWSTWYQEAKSISGIDQAYDDNGNVIE